MSKKALQAKPQPDLGSKLLALSPMIDVSEFFERLPSDRSNPFDNAGQTSK